MYETIESRLAKVWGVLRRAVSLPCHSANLRREVDLDAMRRVLCIAKACFGQTRRRKTSRNLGNLCTAMLRR